MTAEPARKCAAKDLPDDLCGHGNSGAQAPAGPRAGDAAEAGTPQTLEPGRFTRIRLRPFRRWPRVHLQATWQSGIQGGIALDFLC